MQRSSKEDLSSDSSKEAKKEELTDQQITSLDSKQIEKEAYAFGEQDLSDYLENFIHCISDAKGLNKAVFEANIFHMKGDVWSNWDYIVDSQKDQKERKNNKEYPFDEKDEVKIGEYGSKLYRINGLLNMNSESKFHALKAQEKLLLACIHFLVGSDVSQSVVKHFMHFMGKETIKSATDLEKKISRNARQFVDMRSKLMIHVQFHAFKKITSNLCLPESQKNQSLKDGQGIFIRQLTTEVSGVMKDEKAKMRIMEAAKCDLRLELIINNELTPYIAEKKKDKQTKANILKKERAESINKALREYMRDRDLNQLLDKIGPVHHQELQRKKGFFSRKHPLLEMIIKIHDIIQEEMPKRSNSRMLDVVDADDEWLSVGVTGTGTPNPGRT